MQYNLVKKSVVKDGKKYINFYLVNSEYGLNIPVDIKVFKDKKGKITKSSVFAWNLANRTADWITGSDSHKDIDEKSK